MGGSLLFVSRFWVGWFGRTRGLLILLVCVSISACSDGEEQAHLNLEAKGIPLTTDSLIEAIDSKDAATVNEMIKSGITLDAYGARGETPLTAALLFRSGKPTVDLLVNGGTNVNAQNRDGRTPLVLALLGGHDAATVMLILDHGADVNGKSMLAPPGTEHFSEIIEPPLYAAIDRGDLALLRALIERGVDVDQIAGPAPLPPLHWAVAKGLDFVKLLVDAGADVNCRDSAGWTPLATAVGNNILDVAEYLIRHGADVNVTSSDGMALIDLAKKSSSEQMVRLLRANGANKTLQTTEE